MDFGPWTLDYPLGFAIVAYGFNDVFPTERFARDVHAVAERLAASPVKALGAAKSLLSQAAGMDRLDVHLDRELDYLQRIADGPEFAEGLESFFAKRAPQFQPR